MLNYLPNRASRNAVLEFAGFIINLVIGMLQSTIGPAIAYSVNLANSSTLGIGKIIVATAIGCGIILPTVAIGMYIVDMLKEDSDLLYDLLDRNHVLDPTTSRLRRIMLRLSPQAIMPICTIIGMLILQQDSTQISQALASISLGTIVTMFIGGGSAITGREIYNHYRNSYIHQVDNHSTLHTYDPHTVITHHHIHHQGSAGPVVYTGTQPQYGYSQGTLVVGHAGATQQQYFGQHGIAPRMAP